MSTTRSVGCAAAHQGRRETTGRRHEPENAVGGIRRHVCTSLCRRGAAAAVSVGHINPAVTFGVYLAGKINGLNTLGYVIAQCAGAIVAAAMIKVALPAGVLEAVGMGPPALAEGVRIAQGLVTKVILTFLLVFVIFGTAIDRRAPKVGGVYTGLTLTLGTLVGGPLTGEAMNPACHLGPAPLGGGMGHLWLHWVGPLLGGGLAALVCHHGLEQYVLSGAAIQNLESGSPSC